MKRLSIRLGIIGVLMASGILAIAQAQREKGGDESSPEVPLVDPAQQVAGGPEPQPILDDPSAPPVGMAPLGVAPVGGYGQDPGPDYPANDPHVPMATTAPQQVQVGMTDVPTVDIGPPPEINITEGPLPPGAGGVDAPPADITSDPALGATIVGVGDAPPTDPSQPPAIPPLDAAPQAISDPLANVPDMAPTTIPPEVVPETNQLSDQSPTALPDEPVGAPAPISPAPEPATVVSPYGNDYASTPPVDPATVSPAAPGLDLPPVAPAPLAPNDPLASQDPVTVDPLASQDPQAPAPGMTAAGVAAPIAAPPTYEAPAEPYAPSSPPPTYAPAPTQPYASAPAGPMIADASAAPAAAPAAPTNNVIAPVGASQAEELTVAPTPGSRELEGQQTPFVSIEKRAPNEIRVGQPATFEIIVRNAGRVAAQDVTVIDQIPKGTEFLEASPEPQRLANGTLIWSFGSVEPGRDRVVSIRLMPRQEGEIGSVAKVVCQSQASVRTNCTRPELLIKQTAPQQVLIGDELQVLIEVSNPGTGAAENVVLEADLPAELTHRMGRELDYAIGTLQPKETRTVRLHLAAEQAGVAQHAVRAKTGQLQKTSSVDIQIVSPQLQTKIIGPAKRYVRRDASFELELANPGTAAARDIQAVVYLAPGLEFKTASHQGRYQPQNHAIFWRLEELPQGQSGKVEFSVLPVAAGDQTLRCESRGNLNSSSKSEHTLSVASLNELVFTVSDVNDPIEVGSETVYEIRVTNNGSKTDANVEVVAQLPEGMRLINAEGPSKHQANGGVISFAPLPRLAPNGDAVFRISAQGSAAGDHRLRVQISSQESPTPVIKEEVTRVYNDK